MSTSNFPTSEDDSSTLPNPTTTAKTNSPSHTALHTAENDAIKAIESKVGTGTGTTPAANQVLLGTGSGTSDWSGLTSAQLAAVLSDETGSGAAVFANTPTLVTPKVDTISESTANNGVTIDGLNIKDSVLSTNNSVQTSNIQSNAVTTAKIAANAVTSPLLALSHALDATNGVQSYSNAGTWGGTFYYINLGGIRMLWGISANKTISSPGTDYTVTLPTSFFSTIQTAQATPTNLTATGSQYASIDQTGLAASTTTLTVRVNAGITTSAAITLFVIGT